MDTRLANLAADHGGAFTRAQALTCGYNDDDIYRFTRSGAWTRLRRGAFCTAADLPADDAERHLLQAHAVLLSLGSRVALSHTSAAIALGLPVWGVDLSRVHVTRVDEGAARGEAGVVHHVGQLRRDEVVVSNGLAVVNPTRAVLEVASTGSFESAMVTVDAALHQGLTSTQALHDSLELVRKWPGARSVPSVVSFADGRADNPGESRTRVLLHDQDLPDPDLQRPIYDRTGQLVGIVDFLFEEQRTIGEFDGRLKYRGDGQNAADVVYREKRREDRLRALGFEVVRLSWHDLEYPRYTAHRFLEAFARARLLPRVPGNFSC